MYCMSASVLFFYFNYVTYSTIIHSYIIYIVHQSNHLIVQKYLPKSSFHLNNNFMNSNSYSDKPFFSFRFVCFLLFFVNHRALAINRSKKVCCCFDWSFIWDYFQSNCFFFSIKSRGCEMDANCLNAKIYMTNPKYICMNHINHPSSKFKVGL